MVFRFAVSFNVVLMFTGTYHSCSVTNTCSNTTVSNVSILCKTVLHLILEVLSSTFCVPTFDFTALILILISKIKWTGFANLHSGEIIRRIDTNAFRQWSGLHVMFADK